MKDVFPGHNITDIDIKVRHQIVFRLLVWIGQDPHGTRTEAIYQQSYVREGLDLTDEECQLTIRDMFISLKNVGLLLDVSMKSGRGYMLAVSNGGRRYFPHLLKGLPDEEERRKRFGLEDMAEIFDKQK